MSRWPKLPEMRRSLAQLLNDCQIFAPRADLVAVLVRQDAHYLIDVIQVVNHPGGEELAHGDAAQSRMLAGEIEFGVIEGEGMKNLEVRPAQVCELIQKFGDWLVLD